MRPLAILVCAALIAGCLGAEPRSTDTPIEPILRLELVARSAIPCELGCREPTVAATGEGIFVTAGREPVVWRIQDDAWEPLPAVNIQGSFTGGDNLLSPRADGGFYFTHLYQPRALQSGGELVGLGFHAWDGVQWVSHTMWGPEGKPIAPLVDRQWLTDAGGGRLLLSYSEVGAAIWWSESNDAGLTWSDFQVFITSVERGNVGGQAGAPRLLPSGAVAIPMSSSQGLALAVRSPGATTSELRPVPGVSAGGLPQAAVVGGTVHLVWGDREKFYAATQDEGRTWSQPISLGDDFTRPAAGPPSSNAAPWLASHGEAVYVMGLKQDGPWLARLAASGAGILQEWTLAAPVPAGGATDHAHFDVSPAGMPCLTWNDGTEVSVACLEESA